MSVGVIRNQLKTPWDFVKEITESRRYIQDLQRIFSQILVRCQNLRLPLSQLNAQTPLI